MFKISSRTAAIFVFDLSLAMLSLPLAAFLRLGWNGLVTYLPIISDMTLLFTLVSTVVFAFARLQRIAWRFISLNDVILIAATSATSNLVFLTLMFMVNRLEGVPRSIIVINTLLLTFMMIGCRIVLRLWNERSPVLINNVGKQTITPVLIIGATEAADAFILSSLREPQSTYKVIGIIDTGARPKGSLMRGVPVLDHIEHLDICFTSLVAKGTPPKAIVVADSTLRGQRLEGVVDLGAQHSIKILRLPNISDLENFNQKKSLKAISLEDLLSREENTLDRIAMEGLIRGKRVLITGAGGSIGSELVRQVATLNPAHVTLVELSEFNLYEIDRFLAGFFPALSRSALISDVRDRNALEKIFSKERPDIVFHTAALKHVPLLENQSSQAVLTNIIGTRNVSDASVANNVQIMVMVSTDKAAHPVSIMGASKRIAESYCQSLDMLNDKSTGTRFITVRFGNVLGSAGSVVPLFQKQIDLGGPVTVTHRDMTRYFMTTREAVQLVLLAGTLPQNELERGNIVILDMGEPIRILDMAEQMIKLAGLRPNKDIKIAFTGLRPGERLTETLFQPDEELMGTSYKSIQIASAKVGDHAFIRRMVDQLYTAAKEQDDVSVNHLLELSVLDFAERRKSMEQDEIVSPPQHSEI